MPRGAGGAGEVFLRAQACGKVDIAVVLRM